MLPYFVVDVARSASAASKKIDAVAYYSYPKTQNEQLCPLRVCEPSVRRYVMLNDGRGHRTSAWSSVSSPSEPVHPSMGGGQKVMKKKYLITSNLPILGFGFRKRFPICSLEQDADDSARLPDGTDAQPKSTA